jgi:hypothetical protein
MLISSIIEKEQAEILLSKKNGIWPARRNLIKIQLVYLPMYLFTIILEENNGSKYSELISVDGIKGEFAFFRESDYEQSTTDVINKSDFKLTEPMARDIAIHEYQRLLFKNNLKTRFCSEIKEISRGSRIYYPYWFGYFKRRGSFDFEVIDAVGGSKQGVKMYPVFIELILQAADNKVMC